MDGSERVIQSLAFIRGTVVVSWISRDSVHEEGRSYLQQSLSLTRADHPQEVAHFEHQCAILLEAALLNWNESPTTMRVPNSQPALRSTLRLGRSVVPELTPREQQVLDLLVEGLTMDQMSGRLGISHSTAKSHMASLYERLGCHNAASAVVAAIKAGLVKIE